MDSGTSGGSMQSGSNCDEDQHDPVGVSNTVSVPQPHHHQQQQPVLFSTHHHLQYPTLNNNSNSNSFGSTNYHMSNSFMDQFLQPDPAQIWSMNIHNTQPRASTTTAAAPAQSFSLPTSTNIIVQSQQKPQQKPNPVPSSSSLGAVPQAHASAQPGQVHDTSSTRVTKKRTRASRKTPTTVLTTDTSNFRAMVQEFTGIPTPPFGPSLFSSSSSSKKFDLFGSGLDPSLVSLLYNSLKSNDSNSNLAINTNMSSNASNPYAPPLMPPTHTSLLSALTDHTSPTSYQPHNQAAVQNHNPNVTLTFQQVMHPPFSSSINYSTGASSNTGNVIGSIAGFSARQNVEQSNKGQEGGEHNHSIPSSTHG